MRAAHYLCRDRHGGKRNCGDETATIIDTGNAGQNPGVEKLVPSGTGDGVHASIRLGPNL
jgi:hypothetical protein